MKPPSESAGPDALIAATINALQKWPGAGTEARFAAAFLTSRLANVLLLASLEASSGAVGGVFGAVWGARCNPVPATPAFPMTDSAWYDDASISSQGQTKG